MVQRKRKDEKRKDEKRRRVEEEVCCRKTF